MKSLVSAVILVFSAQVAAAAGGQHVLQSQDVRVIIDTASGGIVQIYNGSSPMFGTGDDLLSVAAGNFRPDGLLTTSSDSTAITLVSPSFVKESTYLPLRSTIAYHLTDNRLTVDYCFEALDTLELSEGLDIDISSSSWDSLVVRNHFSGEGTIAFGSSDVKRHALNQVYEFHSVDNQLSLVFPNPYHSIVTITADASHSFEFNWHVLVVRVLMRDGLPNGPPLASVLVPGVKIRRQIELIITDKDEAVAGPIAYFSPFPDGYDQVIAMTFDDIPFASWHNIPESGYDSGAPLQQYLVRLLEDHPKMKMGWIILLDAIWSETQIQNPGYPPGRWWLAHGLYHLLSRAPAEFHQWMRDLEQDNLVYGYEDQVHLGSHGYHHVPEMKFGAYWEFQYYDPEVNDGTFATIANEFSLLGLNEKSLKWIRFPGFRFTRSTIDALIKYDYILFDYWGTYRRLPWMLFYSEHGRIWGIGTEWEGDTPSPYQLMDDILGAGKLCHTAGHPYAWFDGGDEAAYLEIDQIFDQAEASYPNLGYMFPDDVGFFADETYDLHDIETEVLSDAFVFSFSGATTLGQSIVMEWPDGYDLPTVASVDGLNVQDLEARGRRFLIGLPDLEEGRHVVRVPAVLCVYCDPDTVGTPPKPPTPQITEFALAQNDPNPFNPTTTIRFSLDRTDWVSLVIYSISGKTVRTLVGRSLTIGRHSREWDGTDDRGQRVASGMYFYRLTLGERSLTRKMVFLK